MLALNDESLLDVPLTDRRALLELALSEATAPVHVAPATTDRELAERWFEQYEGAGLDGVIAKPLALRYRQDERAMFKIKHERTADVVVAGYRLHKSGPVVGSLLLGLYDDRGHPPARGRVRRVPHETARGAGGGAGAAADGGRRASTRGRPGPTRRRTRRPGCRGAPSRWSAKKDFSWVPLRPEQVAEVAYDHMENGVRFRHTARFRRWRPDRTADSCTYAQLEEPVNYDLAEILGT